MARALIDWLARMFARPRPSPMPPPVETITGEPDPFEGLRHFTRAEFGPWADEMSPALLKLLDDFRAQWGAPVTISAHPQALGRRLGTGSKSQHNVDVWGEVRAADIFPRGMTTQDAVRRAFSIADSLGAGGIGVYVDTSPQPMLHLDVRERLQGRIATWGRVAGHYRSFAEAIAQLH